MKLAHIAEILSFSAAFALCAFIIAPIAQSGLYGIANEQLASTASMGASIEANPTNTLAAQLRDWQSSLEARDAEVAKREEELRRTQELELEQQRNILISTILFFLVALIATNTYTHHRDLSLLDEHHEHTGFLPHAPRVALAGATDLRTKRDLLYAQRRAAKKSP